MKIADDNSFWAHYEEYEGARVVKLEVLFDLLTPVDNQDKKGE